MDYSKKSKNIYLHKSGNYEIKFMYKGSRYCCCAQTLEKAIERRDALIKRVKSEYAEEKSKLTPTQTQTQLWTFGF